jgi:hypothetical protein
MPIPKAFVLGGLLSAESNLARASPETLVSKMEHGFSFQNRYSPERKPAYDQEKYLIIEVEAPLAAK